jgi:hypothetical protein
MTAQLISPLVNLSLRSNSLVVCSLDRIFSDDKNQTLACSEDADACLNLCDDVCPWGKIILYPFNERLIYGQISS